MILDIAFILLGFLLLAKGSDYLIDGAVAIARRAKLSTMVIGLTVIGFGTSTPELLVSAQAAWIGSSAIAIGNVVGSNIANIALILGATALFRALPSSRHMMMADLPFMILAMTLLVAAGFSGTIQRWMGVAMVALLIVFVGGEVRRSRRENKRMEAETQDTEQPMALWKALLIVVVSITAMMWGSDLLIKGATGVAMTLGEMLGVDATDMERIIGLTIVAAGTSLPELFASVMAARKGETDMAVGNIIGSVTFNILCVIGVASAITPICDAWTGFAIDYILMLGLGGLLWLFLRTSHKLSPKEGLVLLIIYVLFLAKTILIV